MLKKGDVKMIKKFLEQGLSKSAIARKLGIARNTVTRYANKPENYIPIIERNPVDTSVDKYLPYIAKMLQTAKKENVHIPTTVIYEEIKTLGYDRSLRWLQTNISRHELREKAQEEELVRFETNPGVQMQVDWIEFPKDNLSAFVATMGYSRASYVEYVSDEKIETLIQCHLNAFAYFGGVPKEGLYDNMKTVIIQRNAYGYGKHKLNPLFEDFAKHCGFKIKLCKPYRAKTKGKVERFNHYLRYSFHNGLRVKLSMKNWELNIDNANSEVLKWLDNKANKRIHSTTLQQPLKLLQDEVPTLLSLPQPYNGIHPRSISNIVPKEDKVFTTKPSLRIVSIPNRDLQGYDALIPSVALIVPAALLMGSSLQVGGSLWN